MLWCYVKFVSEAWSDLQWGFECLCPSRIGTTHFVVHRQGTSCCRTIHCKIPGYWPKDGGGDVQITFTKQSVDVIAKVVNMKGWVVAPTMTRGAKKVGATLAGNMSQLGPNVPKPAKRVKKKILKPQPKETVPVEEEELGDASIRRTQQGRDNIKKIMKNLFELDKAVFPNAPAFDTLGRCRLKFQGADSYLWPDLLEASGRTFECMYLGDVNDVGQCTPRSSYPKDVVHSLCGLI